MKKQAIKRTILVLLALCLMLLPCTALAAGSEVIASGEWETGAWKITADWTMTISGTGDMEDGQAPWYLYHDLITTVVIEEGVTSIGRDAFYDCSSLTSIIIPGSVTSIGDSAFYNCSSLTSIIIPDSVTSIGDSAFYNCSSLISITIPSSVTSIGVCAFWGCSSLTSVTIPGSVAAIGTSTFADCSSLTGITIQEGVTAVDYNAFGDCSSLASITIPASVISISGHAFPGCDSLTEIKVSSGNAAYASVDGVLYNKELTELICCPEGKTGTVEMPEGVTIIAEDAFRDCSSLISVTIPASVTGIAGIYAFLGCDHLTEIVVSPENTSYASVDGALYELGMFTKSLTTLIRCPAGKTGSMEIPDTVSEICETAFWGCSSLTSVIIPEYVSRIEEDTFYGCSGLTSMTIPDGVYFIGWGAFSDCSGLTDITIPSSVTFIHGCAFSNCSSLTDVYYGGSEESWAAITINREDNGNDSLLNATIHYNSTGPEVEVPKKPGIIIDGTDESYTQGSDGSVVIHCSGELADFVSVSVDGQVVARENYTLEAGSTILAFKSAYLETLSVREHAVTLTYTTGTVDTSLTVLKNSEQTEPEKPSEPTKPEKPADPAYPDNPKTGDTALLMPAVLMSVCALSLLCLNRKKRIQ